ncbi:GNAT family N-acetyltransferase [Paenibacillus lemnae]|uniref:GNAT family N-acetyltransferase n=1 Tax=Paenibacillus lemnae TaxID=1330551 RepID=A0A848MAS8_PAELE|nr:GNAT family N-acetyltransferase [Paenibacillus lemnae]NMO97063.1 GNAT family N-acetyltransferase [Paenibacillus lemnae]
MLRSWEERYTSGVIELWNREATKDGYKEWTEQSFQQIITGSPYFKENLAYVLLDRDVVKGFICGCTGEDLPLGDRAGYLTALILDSSIQEDQYFLILLEALESQLKISGKKQMDCLFFNPMKLPWYIPGTPHHEHNNAPGIPVESRLYAILLMYGYIERAEQCAMYLNLDSFDYPDVMLTKEQAARENGYVVELFDKERHDGISEMLSAFNNPLWDQEITASAANGTSFVAAIYDGQCIGFAGPVIRQENGRGYFAGIGVMEEHEGHGLGSILFFKLCEAFKDMGTEYMSLFTGSNNPALRIYKKAGFQHVKTFSTMRKEFSDE